MQARGMRRIGLLGAFVVLAVLAGRPVAAGTPVDAGAMLVAQAHGTEQGELQPRYQPVPPEEPSWYNSTYVFALTRGVAGSTMVPAAKVPLYVFTVPLDLVLLPFAAIGGLFG